METKDKTQIAILILIAVLIIVLVMAIVVLAKNADEIRSNPVQYSIDKEIYDSCSCMQDNAQINFGNKMVIQTSVIKW